MVQVPPRVPVLVISMFITVSLAGYGWRQYLQHIRRNDLLAFVVLMAALSLSMLVEIFLRTVTSPALKLLGFNFINTVCIWISSYALLWFALAYSNNTQWVNQWTIGIAVATPITFGAIGTVAPEFLYEAHGLVMHGPVTILGVRFQQWYTLDRTLKSPFLFFISMCICWFFSLGVCSVATSSGVAGTSNRVTLSQLSSEQGHR